MIDTILSITITVINLRGWLIFHFFLFISTFFLFSVLYSEQCFYVYIYKVLISFFGCPIITHEPLTDMTQILIGELGRTTGMFLVWF